MKNILHQTAHQKVCGRMLFATQFIEKKDVVDKKILDIGCGFGWQEIYALENCCRSIDAIDANANDIVTARHEIKDRRVHFRIGSALTLPYPDRSYDTVIAWEIIEHLPKHAEKRMFEEVRRILKRRGVFYMSTPYNNFFTVLFDPAWWITGHRHYSEKQVQKFGQDVGLAVRKIAIKGGLWEIGSILNLYVAKWIFRRFPFYNSFFERKQNAEYKMKKGMATIFCKFQKSSSARASLRGISAF